MQSFFIEDKLIVSINGRLRLQVMFSCYMSDHSLSHKHALIDCADQMALSKRVLRSTAFQSTLRVRRYSDLFFNSNTLHVVPDVVLLPRIRRVTIPPTKPSSFQISKHRIDVQNSYNCVPNSVHLPS